jgi:hypothetical protein
MIKVSPLGPIIQRLVNLKQTFLFSPFFVFIITLALGSGKKTFSQ